MIMGSGGLDLQDTKKVPIEPILVLKLWSDVLGLQII